MIAAPIVDPNQINQPLKPAPLVVIISSVSIEANESTTLLCNLYCKWICIEKINGDATNVVQLSVKSTGACNTVSENRTGVRTMIMNPIHECELGI